MVQNYNRFNRWSLTLSSFHKAEFCVPFTDITAPTFVGITVVEIMLRNLPTDGSMSSVKKNRTNRRASDLQTKSLYSAWYFFTSLAQRHLLATQNPPHDTIICIYPDLWSLHPLWSVCGHSYACVSGGLAWHQQALPWWWSVGCEQCWIQLNATMGRRWGRDPIRWRSIIFRLVSKVFPASDPISERTSNSDSVSGKPSSPPSMSSDLPSSDCRVPCMACGRSRMM